MMIVLESYKLHSVHRVAAVDYQSTLKYLKEKLKRGETMAGRE